MTIYAGSSDVTTYEVLSGPGSVTKTSNRMVVSSLSTTEETVVECTRTLASDYSGSVLFWFYAAGAGTGSNGDGCVARNFHFFQGDTDRAYIAPTSSIQYADTSGQEEGESGTTATVTHTSHGMLTNDKVLIEGASLIQNRGVFTITVTGPNAYTYTMDTAPGSNPTGTILSTWTALYGTTDVNGQISMSRVFSVNQPVTGWARKSTSSPYYKTGPISGTISSSDGLSLTALLLSDE
jgi:hypothetical protein